jgi:c-di-GMP-binding flagellar brake protein YcgR
MSFVQIQPDELEVGRPVINPLYDSERRLLLARGVVVESEHQREQLLMRGLYRQVATPTRPRANRPEPEPVPEPEPTQTCQFDDIHVGVGESMQLQSHIHGATDRFGVKLIGYVKDRSLIVTTPKQNGYVMLLREGQEFVVRFFSGKSAYAFPASILKVLNTPYPHLHLTYPREVSGLLVRSGMRARVNLIASVSRADGESHGASLHDLSIGGAMLRARRRFGVVDERVGIKFRVDVTGIEQYVSLPAMIRSLREEANPEDGETYYHHGVQFVDIEPQAKLALSAFVFQTLLDESVDL